MKTSATHLRIAEGAQVRGLCPESILLTAFCLADAIATLFLVSQGWATEANPVMAWFLARGANVFMVAKLVSFVPFVVVCEVYRRSRPAAGRRVARIALWGYLSLYVVLVAVVNLRFR